MSLRSEHSRRGAHRAVAAVNSPASAPPGGGDPTAGLDPIGAAKFDELIRELADTMGLTVFLITHDLDSLYATCDRVAVLAEKKVIAVGTIPELLATEHPWIQDYFNGPRGRAAAGGNQTAKRR